MKKNYTLFLYLVLLLCSCGKDDGITPLPLETNPDSISIVQNSEIEIFIFLNDSNIPSNGNLTLTSALKGNAIILENSTPNDISDDSIKYTANANEIGVDDFEYTICTTSGDCRTERISITIVSESTVAFNLENVPYQTLSEYNFFEGSLKELNPNFGVVPYTLNSALFSDYAQKKRFVWMPNNTKASYINDDVSLDFPIGAVLIKNFYYNHVLPNDETQLIETRLMIRKNEGWVFANYVWNEAQDEANLDLNGSFVDLQWLENGEVNTVQYRIPSEAKCFTCHKILETPEPIGPKPRNLNLEYDYEDGSENQLDKLVAIGYLDNSMPETISRLPNYNDISQPLESRVRAYLEINCAHCHSEETHCSYRPMRFGYNDSEEYVNMGVCVDADTDLGEDLGHIIEPGDARNSVLHFRLSSLEPSTRMPLLGRSLRHNEGVDLIEEWIDSLNTDCN
ncbi:Ig-like domain-containing protein [Winogradskyella forsetii]|uniref:Ig-like domain-containing protein n=1 Tax=Winogradskyella forsetii TaxID=2686077 RepID=UPI0021184B9B|nr:hypothetical protein [Winogradskyella forsetii]